MPGGSSVQNAYIISNPFSSEAVKSNALSGPRHLTLMCKAPFCTCMRRSRLSIKSNVKRLTSSSPQLLQPRCEWRNTDTSVYFKPNPDHSLTLTISFFFKQTSAIALIHYKIIGFGKALQSLSPFKGRFNGAISVLQNRNSWFWIGNDPGSLCGVACY